MKFTLKIFITILLATFTQMGFAQKLTSYTNVSTNGKCPSTPSSIATYTVNKNNQIVSIQYKSLDNELEGKINFLENCKVADEKNWECGGDKMDLNNGTVIVFTKTTSSNGKITVDETHRLSKNNLKKIPILSSDSKEKFCRYEKTLIGYKEVPY